MTSDAFLHPNPHWYREVHSVTFIPRPGPRPTHAPPADTIPLSEVPASPLYPVDVRFIGQSHWLCGDGVAWRHPMIYTIEYIKTGNCQVRQGRRQRVYGPGDVFILHPGESCVYRAVSTAPLIKYFCALHINTPVKRQVLQSMGLLTCEALRIPVEKRDEIEGLFERMLHTAHGDVATCRAPLCAVAYELLLHFSTLVQAPASALPYPAPLLKALQFVHDTGLHVRVADMARAAGVSVEHLNRLFSAHLGRRTHEWLLRLRMATAVSMLTSTRMKVHEIASELGYETSYSFCRAFMRMNKITPMQCRRQMWRQRGVATS